MKNYQRLAFAFLLALAGCTAEPTSTESVDRAQATDMARSKQASVAVYRPMTTDSPQAAEIRAVIDGLIEQASKGKTEILDSIYHPDMSINMFSPTLELMEFDKPSFISHLESLIEKADAKPSTWAKFHKVEANEAKGHVLISRKINDKNETPEVTLSIDLVKEDGRWLISREVIFMHR